MNDIIRIKTHRKQNNKFICLFYKSLIYTVNNKRIYIPRVILELSGTIPESADKVGFLLCAGAIPESYLFLLCAEHLSVIPTLSDDPYFALPIKFLLCPTQFLLCAQIISDDSTIYIPCAILELSGTIPELVDKVGFLLCAGTIPE